MVTSTYVDGLLTVTTTKQALEIAEGIDFSVAGYNAPQVDFAPDSGAWRYLTGPVSWGCRDPTTEPECRTVGVELNLASPRFESRRPD